MRRDYKLFYAILKQRPSIDKDDLVLQFTDGRTNHLTQMTDAEYGRMLAALDVVSESSQQELKRWRSSALLRIGRLGINTIDNWDGINAFVSSDKIAGKPFYDLTVSELQQLVRKLEAIERKGGLHARERKIEKVEVSAALQALSWAYRSNISS